MIQTCINVKSNTERSQTLILKQRNFLNMKNCVLIDYLIIIFSKYLLTAYQEDQHAKRREKLLKNTKHSVALADDPVHNDYKREMLFYRQAQATVIESLARLKNMGLPTKVSFFHQCSAVTNNPDQKFNIDISIKTHLCVLSSL